MVLARGHFDGQDNDRTTTVGIVDARTVGDLEGERSGAEIEILARKLKRSIVNNQRVTVGVRGPHRITRGQSHLLATGRGHVVVDVDAHRFLARDRNRIDAELDLGARVVGTGNPHKRVRHDRGVIRVGDTEGNHLRLLRHRDANLVARLDPGTSGIAGHDTRGECANVPVGPEGVGKRIDHDLAAGQDFAQGHHTIAQHGSVERRVAAHVQRDEAGGRSCHVV